MSPIIQRVLGEPLLVGAANFAVGWVGLAFRLSGLRPEAQVELAIAVGAMLLLLPLNVLSARHYAGYSGPASRVNVKLLAIYEGVGLIGIGAGWVILHAP